MLENMDDREMKARERIININLLPGYPATEDELYARWETARLKLKQSYGAAPEDDLFIMKPKGELVVTSMLVVVVATSMPVVVVAVVVLEPKEKKKTHFTN